MDATAKVTNSIKAHDLEQLDIAKYIVNPG